METYLRILLSLFCLLVVGSADRNYRRPPHCPVDFKYYDPPEVIATYETEDQSTCEQLCDDTEGCQAINYETKATRTCELSEVTTDKWGLDMVSSRGFMHLEKVFPGEPETDTCTEHPLELQKEVIKIDLESEHITHRGTTEGWWCKDPLDEQDRVYYSSGYSNINQFQEFETEEKFVANQNAITHTVKDLNMDGAQHAVYGRKLYYKPHNRRQLIVYDLNTELTHGRITDFEANGNTYSGFSDSCHYDNGRRTDIDVATDESGLWAIWGRQPDNCWVSISKIDTETLTLSRTWHLMFDKNDRGNGFIIHGIYYTTDHYNRANDFFYDIYNLRNNTYRGFQNEYDSYLRIENKNGHMHYANYNPKDGKLYTVEYARQRRYILTLRDVHN